MDNREKFASRLGFVLVSAGCAIGIGNVWRFPYITGQYGGGAFVLIYLVFLVIMGLPIMTMEFAVGRASQKSCGASFRALEPAGSRWHWSGYVGFAGNYLLMMFYTTVSGWMMWYIVKMLRGEFVGATAETAGAAFTAMLANPAGQVFWMAAAVALGFLVCARGLQNGVERVTKVMMVALLMLMLALAVRSVTLPGAAEGLRFYLVPDFARLRAAGIGTVVYAAMGQSFFTLSLGIGSMAIFGSYIGKERRLLSESVNIAVLDTFVALTAGFIIFPACFAYGVDPGQGPGLVFVTLPRIFGEMPGGRIWGAVFFVFLSFAALSTVIAVFENIVAFGMDLWHWSRRKSVLVNFFGVLVLSVPCALGFSVWSGFAPLGPGSTILDLEDFIVSNNLLPLGSLVYVLFCTRRAGWGFPAFLTEANTGRGLRFPKWVRFYVSTILPLIVLFIFVMGYKEKFFA